MKHRVLIVEDEPGVAKGLRYGLEAEGFDVRHARTGADAIHRAKSDAPAIILLDLRLPDMSGFDVCRQIRADRQSMPIIMVTARDEEMDRVVGLEIGADDYVTKPFSLKELVSRVRAQLRRSYGAYNSTAPVITGGGLRIDTEQVRVFKEENELFLTPIEFRLLLALVSSPGRTFSRSQLIEAVWGDAINLQEDRTVDVHIRHLREKVEADPSRPRIIETVRGFGYRSGS